MLPVATFAYLYHTVSGVTLFRYWRLCETYRRADRAARGRRRRWSRRSSATTRSTRRCSRTRCRSKRRPSTRAFQALAAARGSAARDFRREFDAELGGRVSRLVDWKANNEEILASSVREVLGRPARRALRRRGDPRSCSTRRRTASLGETLTLTTHGKLSRALFHPSYTFRKKLSHTADSQDQRHRMTPASRPALPGVPLGGARLHRPDARRRRARGARALPTRRCEETWDAIGELRSRGVADEFAAYLLPNAVAIRFTESADLLNLHHKFAMRLCYNAQEEIWRASLDEALQIREVNPRIGPWLLPPCTLRHHAEVRPVCPEGDRFCGVVVWKQDADAVRPRCSFNS